MMVFGRMVSCVVGVGLVVGLSVGLAPDATSALPRVAPSNGASARYAKLDWGLARVQLNCNC